MLSSKRASRHDVAAVACAFGFQPGWPEGLFQLAGRGVHAVVCDGEEGLTGVRPKSHVSRFAFFFEFSFKSPIFPELLHDMGSSFQIPAHCINGRPPFFGAQLRRGCGQKLQRRLCPGDVLLFRNQRDALLLRAVFFNFQRNS